MGYEVIKTIGTGKYRYEVESYRDPDTGKVRNKWRYIGKAEGNRAPRRRARADETRDKLTSAMERLLRRTKWQEVTAHEIAAEAGVAPATLYRYFRSRDDVLLACASRANEELDAHLAELENIAKTVTAERARLHAWTMSLIADAAKSAVLLALWSSGLNREDLARDRNEHRRRAFASYLERLRELRYITADRDVADGAIALALVVQAFSYRALLGRTPLQLEECTALSNAVVRLVFG
jgi:AcrR family transcriptional regulator